MFLPLALQYYPLVSFLYFENVFSFSDLYSTIHSYLYAKMFQITHDDYLIHNHYQSDIIIHIVLISGCHAPSDHLFSLDIQCSFINANIDIKTHILFDNSIITSCCHNYYLVHLQLYYRSSFLCDNYSYYPPLDFIHLNGAFSTLFIYFGVSSLF